MTKWRNLNYGDTVPEAFFDAIMELLGTYMSSNFRVTFVNNTTLRVPASSGDGQVGVAINGRWRYNTANADAVDPGGAAATHTLWVTASDNSFTAGPPEVDNTVYTFGLQIRASGSPATALARQIGTVEWDGSKIVRITHDNDAGVDPPLPGQIAPYAGSVAPTGWRLCDGSAISRTTFFRLFGAIGTTFGVGDGSTTFNVPDMRGRVGIGAGTGTGLTARTLGATGGEENHALTVAELAAHDHGGVSGSTTSTGTIANTTAGGTIANSAGHTHTLGAGSADTSVLTAAVAGATNTFSRISAYTTGGSGVVTFAFGGPNLPLLGSTDSGGVHSHTFTGTAHNHTLTMNPHTHTIPSQGSGTGHNTMQPFLVLNYIIRTG